MAGIAVKVLLINFGADTGGVLWRTVQAFRGVPDWDVRSMVKSTNYITYPPDIIWSIPEARERWDRADVLHLHHNYLAARVLSRPLKPHVIEYHGTGFRENPSLHIREQRDNRGIGVVSTLDLYLLAPHDTEWLPVPVDAEGFATMKQNGGEVIRIAHAPTNRAIKSTADLIRAVEQLQEEGYPVELDLIEGRPWAECLERKAKADIYFDQVILGYGCNALEAWGMGIPVIAGAADPTLDEMERRFGKLPFYHATPDTIYEALREMVESPELRARYAKRGQEYVRKFHDYPVVVEQLKAIYQRAFDQQARRAA
jgi:hypothetical protein